MKKLVVILMLTASTLSFTKSSKINLPKDNTPDYRAYVLGDDKGNIFYQENADQKYPLASVTKVMTILVSLDEVRQGNISLHDEVV
ncbi:MAG: serine hydrolase, partial [Cetobacterium sp.]